MESVTDGPGKVGHCSGQIEQSISVCGDLPECQGRKTFKSIHVTKSRIITIGHFYIITSIHTQRLLFPFDKIVQYIQ